MLMCAPRFAGQQTNDPTSSDDPLLDQNKSRQNGGACFGGERGIRTLAGALAPLTI